MDDIDDIDDIDQQDQKYWKNNKKLRNIVSIRLRSIVNRSNFSLTKNIKSIVGNSSILDFGCGYGRLTKNFDKKGYLGIDINPFGIQKARKSNPDYCFLIDNKLPSNRKFDYILFYTVILHMSDLAIKNLNVDIKRIIIAESIVEKRLGRGEIGRKKKTPRKFPAYGRKLQQYLDIFPGYKKQQLNMSHSNFMVMVLQKIER